MKLTSFLCLTILVTTLISKSFAQNKLQSSSFITFNGFSSNTAEKLGKNEPVTVAFLGGSITNMEGWRGLVRNYLNKTYPQIKFKFINAGIPSLGSLPHAFRLQRDVLDSGKIDLLFIESAVNDHVNQTAEQTQHRALEGIIRHTLNKNPKTDIVMMAFADEDKNDDFNKGKIPTEVKVHSDLAEYYHLPFINIALEVDKRIANREFTWKSDFKDLHPSPFGQQLYFNTIKTYLEENQKNANKKPTGNLPKIIDKFAYAKGQYISITSAENLNTFSITKNWKPTHGLEGRPGFVNIPVLESSTRNSTFDLIFKGNAVGIAILSGPDAGALHYRIDNGEEKMIDLYTQWSSSLHLPWYLLLGDQLTNGTHKLSVRISDQHNPKSTGYACRIAHFLVNAN
ncbi:SGNH/GDSL hydrolase family protein [Pedobacter psychrodurus]|uniref:SGNH/GDSL hydrolase family protein n=1 Tax=Pedobacter psychrodurus TaxID=2530456 RepID=A0A4R0PUI5_9SPHI|nr:SGNH/GDSL hydrolase family protein [Pedobacter psychrodurus]TCD26170.1 SGNH/GDSL hydrolase family protein [Pedobacter psychrodurus]